MLNRGLLYLAQGRYEEAESSFVQTQDAARRELGGTHVFYFHLMRGLGTVYLNEGRYDEAKRLLDEAYEVGSRILGEENWATQAVVNMQAKLCTAQGRYQQFHFGLHAQGWQTGCRLLRRRRVLERLSS